MSALPLPAHAPAEYLAYDRQADTRHEYFDGVIYAMAGGSYNHAAIINNASRILGNALLDRDCTVTTSDARVQVTPAGPFFYPDVMVVCGSPQFTDEHADTITNPVLIVEVLSPSTASFDRTVKFEQYRRITSLREYVLISQAEPCVTAYSREEDGRWTESEAAGPMSVYHSKTLGVSAALSDLYRRVAFSEPSVTGRQAVRD